MELIPDAPKRPFDEHEDAKAAIASLLDAFKYDNEKLKHENAQLKTALETKLSIDGNRVSKNQLSAAYDIAVQEFFGPNADSTRLAKDFKMRIGL